MSDFVIEAENLGKKYKIGGKTEYRMLREVIRNAALSSWQDMRQILDGRPIVKREDPHTLWALKDVSFQIQQGSSVGVIGNNGAGKSTLLKILARVTVPSTGRVRLRGRVSSLLEVGTGFHPELTGRENVYLNGAILGMRKYEIDRKFDEIVEFSEIEKFLETPVKFYSSGMRMRLAFSVAAHLEPEILLIDEVLAVGDMAFQNKSLNKMGDVVKGGRTVLFVSHNIAAIKALCQSAIYMENGQVKYIGDIEQTIEKYLNTVGRGREAADYVAEPDHALQQILSVSITDEDGKSLTTIAHDQPFRVNIKFALREPVNRTFIAMHILDSDLETVLISCDFDQDETKLYARKSGVFSYSVHVSAPLLVPGSYRLNVQVVRANARGGNVLTSVDYVCPFEIFDNGSMFARVGARWEGKVVIPLTWEYGPYEAEK